LDLPLDMTTDETDPGRWGASLVNNGELLVALLDAAAPRSVIEVGAYAGDLTRLLLAWAGEHGAGVTAIDPAPQPRLVELAAERADLTLVRETSLAALPAVTRSDAIVIDGDHNYYTVTEELKAIAGWEGPCPLILLHDVGWPHGRRDDYFDPATIPAEFRHPTHEGGGLYPGIEGVQPGAMPYRYPAAREGGPRNGVLTAVEDFVAGDPSLRLAVLPTFFGIGVVWPADAPYGAALQDVVAPYDRNPLLTRLENNRVLHLASSQVQWNMAHQAQERLARLEPLLDAMLASRAFWAAELFLRFRQRGKPAFSRELIRRARR
jgi:hypothetical protein